MLKRLTPRCLCQATDKQLGSLVWSASWLRAAEPEAAASLGLTLSDLMTHAGTAAYKVCVQHYGNSTRHWLILVGPGNNGGDGYVIARLAKADQRRVTVLAMPHSKPLPTEAATALQRWKEAGGTVTELCPQSPLPLPQDADLVVDGLLGTGIAGAPRDLYARVIEEVNALAAHRVAIDVPSGLNAETGATPGVCFRAEHTVTFITLKPGLLTGQARRYVGALTYNTLGLDGWLSTSDKLAQAQCRRLTCADLSTYFRQPRTATAHKGTNGKVLLVGGAKGFGGAILMAAEASLATGAGLTRVLTDSAHVTSLLTRCPEAMYIGVDTTQAIEANSRDDVNVEAILGWADVLAIGPGLGQGAFGRSILQATLTHAAQNPHKTLVLDADALNLLPGILADEEKNENRPFPRLPRSIITPHPGEAARLLGCSIVEVESDRFHAARRLANLLGGTCILKGPGSVLYAAAREVNTTTTTTAATTETGNESGFTPANCAVLDAGNAGMACGGMGDILTGVVASIAAQGVATTGAGASTTLHVACAGALAHSVAADMVVAGRGTRGLRATELVPYLTECVNAQSESHR